MPAPKTRREFLRDIAAGSAAVTSVAAFGGRGCADPRHARPNILVVLADDMGYSDIGCFGGEIDTPHLDALAARGLRFTHAYNVSRCCPSRASLLTGLYPHQAGVGDMMSDGGVDGYRGDLHRHTPTIAEVLKPAGYRTYAAGKWHVTRFLPPDGSSHNWPRQRGFDRYFGIVTGAASYYEPQTLLEDNTPIEPDDGFFLTDAIADRTAGFIDEHFRDHADQPFFSYVAFTAPHWPLHAPEADIAKYRGRFDAGWDVLRQKRYARMIEMGLIDPRWGLSPRDGNVPAWTDAPDKAWQLRRMEVYAAQVDRMDRGIGRVVDRLKAHGALDNTLILFLSDNGGCHEELAASWDNYFVGNREKVMRPTTRDGRAVQHTNDPAVMPGPSDTYQSYGYPWANVSNTPFRLFKHWEHEGGISTPLIAHWPAAVQARGDLRRQHGHVIDIMATCVDVAGATFPAAYAGRATTPLEGRSLAPALDDRAIVRDELCWEHEGNRALLTDWWKLVARGAKGPWELYDIAADRTELNDLAATRVDVVSDLSRRWDAWAARTGVLPRPGQATDAEIAARADAYMARKVTSAASRTITRS